MTQRAFGHLRPGNIGQQVDFADTATAYRNDDVPIKAKLARQQALHFMDPDILQRKKQPWNNGTKPSGPYPFDHGPLNKGMPFAPRFPDPSAKRSLHVGTSIKPEIDQRAEKIPKRDPIMPRKTSKLQFDPRRLQHSTLPSNLGGTAAAQPRAPTDGHAQLEVLKAGLEESEARLNSEATWAQKGAKNVLPEWHRGRGMNFADKFGGNAYHL